MRFTALDAMRASDNGAPIMVNESWVRETLQSHNADVDSTFDAMFAILARDGAIDAWVVLTMLGY